MTKEEFELLVQPGDYIRVQTARETVEGTVKALLSSSVLLLRRDGGRSVVEIDQMTRLELDLQPPAAGEAEADSRSGPAPGVPALPDPEECGALAAQAVEQGDLDRAERLYRTAMETDRTEETLTRVLQTVYLSRRGTPEEQRARARRGLELLEQRGQELSRPAYINFRVHLLDDAGETELYKQEMEQGLPLVPQKQRVAYMNLLGKQLLGEEDYAGAAKYFQMWRDTWLQERKPDQESYTAVELKRDLNLAECYMHIPGKQAAALELVESVLQLRPNSARAKELFTQLQGVEPEEKVQEESPWQKGRVMRVDFSQKRDYAGEHDFVNLYGFVQGADKEWYYFQLGWVADDELRRELACACQARRNWAVHFIPTQGPDGKKLAREIRMQPGMELQSAELLPVYTGTLVRYEEKKQELILHTSDVTEYTVKISNVVDPALYHYLKRTPQPGGVTLRYTLSPNRGTTAPARPVRVWMEEQAHREWAEKLAGRRWLARRDLPALEDYLARLDEGRQVCWGEVPPYEPMDDAPQPPVAAEEKVVLPPRVRPYDLGNEAVQKKDYEAAERYFLQAIEQNDRRGKAVSSLITYIYLRVKRSDPDASRRLEEGMELLERHAEELGEDSLSSMRTQLAEKLGDRELFERELRRALTVSYRPTLRMNYCWRLAGILIQRGEYDEAAGWLEQWLSIRDSNAAVLGIEQDDLGKYAAISRMVEQKLAVCCYHLPSRRWQAEQLARKLLERDPRDEVARQILEGSLTMTPALDSLEDIILQEDEELLPPYALHLLDSTPLILFREGELKGEITDGQYVATPEQTKQDIDALSARVRRSGGGENEAQYRVDIWCAMARMTQQTMQRCADQGERLRRNFIDADHVREKMGHALLAKADAMLQSQDTRLDTVRFLYGQSIPLCMAKNPDRSAAFLRLVGTTLLDAGGRARMTQSRIRWEDAAPWVGTAGEDAARELLLCTLSAPEQSAALRGELLGKVYENQPLRERMLEWMDAVLGRAGAECAGKEAFLTRWEECRAAYDLFLKDLEDCLQQCAQQMGSRVVLEENRRRLQRIHSGALLWETDRGRLEGFESKILDQLLILLDRTSFAERRESCVEILSACDQMAQAIYRQPTELSFHCLREVVESIKGRMAAQLNELYRTNAPELSVGLAAENAYLNDNGEVNLSIWVANGENRQMATVQEMEVTCPNEEVECWRMGAAVYRVEGGKRASSAWQFVLPAAESAQGSFDVDIRLDYSYYSGYESGQQKIARDVFTGKLTVPLLGGAEFESIPNPYRHLSGGDPLGQSEKDMFYGRARDLQEIVDHLCHRTEEGEMVLTPRCVLVYGQKRTGKTSLLNFLPDALEKTCGKDTYLPVDLESMGLSGSAAGFLSRVIFRLEETIEDEAPEVWDLLEEKNIFPLDEGRLKDCYARLKAPDTSLEESKDCMIKIFGRVHRILQREYHGKKYVPLFLIDEFTYLYQWLVEGKMDPRFLMFWKAFLEYEVAVVAVGMDSMPEFMAYSYPNMENCFASQKRKHISYLLPDDARALAQDPIRRKDGTSRYQPEALEYLVELTAGSPFLEVIVCNELVDYMNRKRIPRVSRTVLDLVVEQLFREGRLDRTTFEPQLADPGVFGEQAVKDMAGDVRRVLEWICRHCDDVAHEVPESRMLADRDLMAGLSTPTEEHLKGLLQRMVRREVLVLRPSRGVNYYKIKVDLLRRWLQMLMGG